MCSHFYAIRFWVRTLHPNSEMNFPAHKCSSWKNFEQRKCDKNVINFMGIAAHPKGTGVYYVKTKSSQYYNGVDFFNWVVQRIGDRAANIFKFDF